MHCAYCALYRGFKFGWIVQCSGHPNTEACPPIPSRFSQFHLKEREYGRANYRRVSQERLKIEPKLLLSANRKSYMLRRLAQQRTTLSDLEWPFHPYRALSLGVAELLVLQPFAIWNAIKML